MKYDRVRIGGVYWDGKQGVRQVYESYLEAGAEMVRYRILSTGSSPEVFGYDGDWSGAETSRMTKASLAGWAKAELSQTMAVEVLTRIKAERMRFTPAQNALLQSMAGATTETLVECEKAELRVAGKLESLGVLTVELATALGGQLRPSRLGAAVLAYKAGQDFRHSIRIVDYRAEFAAQADPELAAAPTP